MDHAGIVSAQKVQLDLHQRRKIQMQITAIARPRNQQDYTDTAILLDGGFLLLRYSELQFIFAFFTEIFDDQFAAIVIGAVNTFFIYVPSSIWI